MPDTDSKQFKALIEPHLDALFRAAFRLVGNTSDAEDLVQETCVRAFLNELVDVVQPRGWLLTVQHNLFLDGMRRLRHSPIDGAHDATTSAEQVCSDDGPEQSLLRDQAEDALHHAWLGLDRGHRALLALRAEGYTLDEIAEISGLEKDALNARLYRARRSLARHLREERPETEGARVEQPAAASRRMENAK